MIPTKTRETRRTKIGKLPKNLERVYRENNCQECTVVVTRMDFAKILGKFTKVKIQYESTGTPKSKRSNNQVSSNNRLKGNENGLVQGLRNSHSVQKSQGLKKTKNEASNSPIKSNILKENNRAKRTYSKKTNNDEYDNTTNNYKSISSKIKHYGIVFENPAANKNDLLSTISLEDLIPNISDSILPSENWSIDYFPKNGEPKDDKVYDRIAAELEDLMSAEKNANVTAKDDKVDEFPSIMDILNDNPKDDLDKNDQNNSVNLESNDVEAMLLGKADQSKSTTMDIDNTDVSSFLTDVTPVSNETTDNSQEATDKTQNPNIMDESPESPSILDENTQKESTVQIQSDDILPKEITDGKETPTIVTTSEVVTKMDENDNTETFNNVASVSRTGVTQVIFKKNVNGTCQKSVICPKNLKYSICMLSKSVELLGAPKVISSIEDLQVLLQIVEESNLDSIYVLH